MPLKGDAAVAHVKALLRAQQAAADARVAAARAAAPGKEPFNFDTLRGLMDVRAPFTHAEAPEIAAELEREYWLRFPEVKTLREFAEKRAWLDARSGG